MGREPKDALHDLLLPRSVSLILAPKGWDEPYFPPGQVFDEAPGVGADRAAPANDLHGLEVLRSEDRKLIEPSALQSIVDVQHDGALSPSHHRAEVEPVFTLLDRLSRATNYEVAHIGGGGRSQVSCIQNLDGIGERLPAAFESIEVAASPSKTKGSGARRMSSWVP